jgi:anti-sigma B factor antagonist
LSSPTNASLLEVEVSEDDRLLTLRGELCLSTADQLREPLFAAVDGARGDIVLDLTECTFIDSSGLEVLALGSWRLAATDPRREFVVVSPRSAVRKILDLTGMDHILTVSDARRPGAGEAERARAVTERAAAR